MSSVKEEAITLRKQGLSLRDISSRLSVAKGTLSGWLKNVPLTPEQRSSLLSRPNSYHTPKKFRGEQSALSKLAGCSTLSREGTGRVAEAAVLLRATVLGLEVYGCVFDGDKADWLVRVPSGKIAKIQVKATRVPVLGLPTVSLTCSKGHNGKRRYMDGEFDFIVGYDLFTDTAFVYGLGDVAGNQTTVSTSDKFAEKWQKVLEF